MNKWLFSVHKYIYTGIVIYTGTYTYFKVKVVKNKENKNLFNLNHNPLISYFITKML